MRQFPGHARWFLGGLLAVIGVIASAAGAGGAARAGDGPVAIHPENPKYFLFRGRPLFLLTASEHYGSVINRPFDYERYLADAADKGMTLTRTFLLYRELQTPRNPSSSCKPESPDYLAPWPRTGPGKALDKEPIYDLDRWNEEFFSRLRAFLTCAARRGIVVELTLFSHTYNDNIWALNPLRAENNKQQIGKVPWHEYDSLRNAALVERQKAYARKIVEETSEFDNLYYEICNEPAGNVPISTVTTADVEAWQAEMGAVIRGELARLGRKHLVFGTPVFDVAAMSQPCEASFRGKVLDAVNLHPNTFMRYRDRNYRMGDFMSKQLTLFEVRDFCVDTYGEPKPLVLDEDNAAAMYRDLEGWTIHRKRAWAALVSGAHYDFIDFSINVGHEAGTRASSRAIRSWFKHLSRFMSSFDFIHARPGVRWTRCAPRPLLVCTLAVEGKDYLAYLGDGRELSDPGAGKPISGKIELDLPQGKFEVMLYSPVTGEYSPSVYVDGGRQNFELLPFEHDVVIRAKRVR